MEHSLTPVHKLSYDHIHVTCAIWGSVGSCRNNVLQLSLALAAKAAFPAIILGESLQHHAPVHARNALLWVLMWACMAQASSILPLMSSTLYDVLLAGLALMMMSQLKIKVNIASPCPPLLFRTICTRAVPAFTFTGWATRPRSCGSSHDDLASFALLAVQITA